MMQTDRTRLAIVAGAIVVLIASIVGFMAAGGEDTTSTAPAEAASTASTDAASQTAGGENVDLPVPVEATATPTSASTDAGAATTAAATATSAATNDSAATATSASEATASSITFSSSPPVSEGARRGCGEGLILVGSNGTDPICQVPGAGCPEAYSVIGGVDGVLLCKGIEGDVLRVQPDGTVTLDTSVPFNGPVCQKTDAEGNVLELTLAVDEPTCVASGGQFLPEGL